MAPIEAEIRRFLADANPEVLCIRGDWGVGKTYAWKRFLKATLDEKAVALDLYSYVSLFGISSIRDAKRAIFENQISLALDQGPDASTVARTMAHLQGLTRKSWHGAVQLLPFVKNAAEEFANAAFALIHDQIICLDDLERLGQGVRVKDVLGLVSYLKEEKNCKIILLLNTERMNAKDKEDFESQIEKVIDVELEFSPSPSECASIGLSDDFPLRDDVEKIIIALKIANIRTIKRIERMALQALKLVEGLHDNVRAQVVTTVAIGTWAKHQPNDAPSLDYLKRYNAFTAAWDDKKDGADPQKKAWNEIIESTGYMNSDELDIHLLDGVDAGFFDPDMVRAAAAKVDIDHSTSSRGTEYSQSWRLYHNSFKPNDDEVLDAMFEAACREPTAINPSNMSASVRLFREMGREEQASKMIKTYVDAHSNDRNFFDLTEYPFEMDVTDEELRKAFADKYDSFVDRRNPEDVFLECARRSGWNRDDEELLGKLTVDDLVSLFDGLDGEGTSTIVKMALRMGIPAKDGGPTVADNAAAALRKIAERSPLNRRRVKGYGVELECGPEAAKI